MILKIYNKDTLEIIGRPVVSSLEDFEKDPNLFFPDFNKENHIFCIEWLFSYKRTSFKRFFNLYSN